jgi:hypothetical protein
LGPVIKGSLWETTALPEIRVQARDLAEHLLGILVHEAVNPEPVADSTTLWKSPFRGLAAVSAGLTRGWNRCRDTRLLRRTH